MYKIEIRKNGAVVHHREFGSEAAAMRAAQSLATAFKAPVLVITPHQADSVRMVRPAF